MREIVFEITQEADGRFVAECLGESIYTQADSWEELQSNVKEAIAAFYFDCDKPESIRFRLVGDEMLVFCRDETPVACPQAVRPGAKKRLGVLETPGFALTEAFYEPLPE